jgi:RNA polymerase sigma factor (sigma-70 family)
MSRTAIPSEESVAPARRPNLGALSSCALRHESDDRLVSLTRAGSERAFAEIMRRYQRPLYLFCLQFLGAGRSEDAVQQAFLQAFVALRDGAHREIALRPWLYRIARNCSIDLLRKQGSDHDELDPEYDGRSGAEGRVEQKEELARIVAAILALPERQRRALTLRELEGRSYGEISAELGHTDSGVRQLIFRARTTLRNLGAVLIPVGSLRWRLLGQAAPGVTDPHQVAAAASVPATVTLAAGGTPAVHHHHAAMRGSEAAITGQATAPLSASSLVLAAAAPRRHAKKVNAHARLVTLLTAPVSIPATEPALVPAVAPAAQGPPAPVVPNIDPTSSVQAAPPVAAPADAAGAATTLSQKPGTVQANALTGVTGTPATTGATGPQGAGSNTSVGKPKPFGSAQQTDKVPAPKAPKAVAPKQPAAPKQPTKPSKPQPAKPQPAKAVTPAQPAKATAAT